MEGGRNRRPPDLLFKFIYIFQFSVPNFVLLGAFVSYLFHRVFYGYLRYQTAPNHDNYSGKIWFPLIINFQFYLAFNRLEDIFRATHDWGFQENIQTFYKIKELIFQKAIKNQNFQKAPNKHQRRYCRIRRYRTKFKMLLVFERRTLAISDLKKVNQ